jgi:glutamyl/glutaminyl-tRNA synthetase
LTKKVVGVLFSYAASVKAKERSISKYAAELINSGNAYYAFDTAET